MNDNHIKIHMVIEEIKKIKATNVSEMYSSHLYWSQKPFNITQLLIDKLSDPGDFIFDPFMGSGVTIIESLKDYRNRIAIGSEISDYPIFLLDSLLKSRDISILKHEADEILSIIKIAQDYRTECEICKSYHNIVKTNFNIKDNKYTIDKIYYKCDLGNKLLTKKPTDKDVELFSKYDNKKFKNFQNLKLIKNSRLAVKKDQHIFDIFTYRNLNAIDFILETIKAYDNSDLFLYALLGIIHLSKIVDAKSSSQWPLWIPKQDCYEKNVYILFEKSLNRAMVSAAYSNVHFNNVTKVNSFNNLKSNQYLILKNGTQNIDEKLLPNDTIDLIITDPPYLDQVAYSENMQLYQPFLKLNIDFKNEIVISNGEGRDKSKENYFLDMEKSLIKISNVLKSDGVLCMYFHDSGLELWSKLIEMTKKANLEFVTLTHVSKNKQTLKNIVSPLKSLKGDALLFFIKKDKNVSLRNQKVLSKDVLIEISLGIIKNNNGKATTAELYDNGILNYLIINDLLDEMLKSYKDLTYFFKEFLNWNIEGYWEL